MNVAQGIIRARYRDSWTEPSPMRPGEICRFEIDCWSSSNCFRRGHRIRVEISSSNYPQFDRNPNTGHPFGLDTELRAATQTVYHDPGAVPMCCCQWSTLHSTGRRPAAGE